MEFPETLNIENNLEERTKALQFVISNLLQTKIVKTV